MAFGLIMSFMINATMSLIMRMRIGLMTSTRIGQEKMRMARKLEIERLGLTSVMHCLLFISHQV